MNAKTITYTYPAHITQQTASGKPLVFFAAPATEIDRWVGVPQRSRLDDEETIGFQRQENKTRIRELSSFYHDERNIVQNPLLAAPQTKTLVEFEELDGHPQFGTIKIVSPDFSDTSLLDLMTQVVEQLESRVPELKETDLDPDRLSSIMDRGRKEHGLEVLTEEDDEEDEEGAEENGGSGDDTDAASVLLTDETHLIDFYTELKGRIRVLEALDTDVNPDRILGFDRGAMISYLKPVMLVDGQHRLKGAVLAAESLAEGSEGEDFLLDAAEAGKDPGQAKDEFIGQHSRQLPVSLLMDDSPSEHVFQFVVVNQKATPMGKALLGTIVSTSLSKEELDPVAQRLKDAGIKLDDSQAIAYLTRTDESPFKNFVQTGITGATGDQNTHLQWSVLKGLVSIFRELSGGKLFAQKNDWAKAWAKFHLDDSSYVATFDTHKEKLAEWGRPDGPWREVFIRFYSNIREKFGSDDPEALNAWGTTRSNLFNKVSLTILAADYFEYLRTQKRTLNNLADVDATMSEWLDGVNLAYFNRNWKVEKKDTPLIRRTWARLWNDYRRNPDYLPKEGEFNPTAGA
ncbi:hypothetical protein CP967_15310 [Streptomyces nitrosporeus]|uniref:DGQHR domain-containing protein n=1 Tax=Streptomyces nitrosporeus TaxID=28894 RepID=A0A5J6FAA5_9ACTN|nr:hypothetical protein [Streptomyces nitrosporeus]QEU73191.1 hypothetical protein CP967_15310 [Streptomyces nitrosporeus]GGZ09838.1 hypothetical protein GCM10010327_45580 [Streptomyces nitrosporeus]